MKYIRIFSLISILALASLSGVSGNPRKDSPPNIVFVFVDDMGWGDAACYGNGINKTPNLDKMAKEGLLFTNFTVASPVCTPSRVGVMTGRYPSRLSFHGHLDNVEVNQARGMPNFLDPGVPTLTKLLKSAGYATGHFGKWHMGSMPDRSAPTPSDYGIDVSGTTNSNGPRPYRKEGDTRAHSSTRVMDQTLDFIKASADGPFFINCWINDPHSVLRPNEEQLADYPELESMAGDFASAMQVYSAVITDIDRQVGRLFEKLDELGIAENTLVIFSSDNGPAPIWGVPTMHSGTGSVGPLRGCKASLYEGGIRVPFIAWWPGKVPSDKVDDNTVISAVDLLPTFCSLAGVELSEKLDLDGQDMSKALMGKRVEREKPLMWEYRWSPWGRHIQNPPMLAMRDGDWKLLMNPDGSRKELYNLKENPSEVDNLANENPEILERMSRQLLDWHSTIPGREFIPESAGSNEYPWPGTEPTALPWKGFEWRKSY